MSVGATIPYILTQLILNIGIHKPSELAPLPVNGVRVAAACLIVVFCSVFCLLVAYFMERYSRDTFIHMKQLELENRMITLEKEVINSIKLII